MKSLLLVAGFIVLVGCSKEPSLTVVPPSNSNPEANKVIVPHPLTDDIKKAQELKKEVPKPDVAVKPEVETTGQSKVDPAVLGSYRIFMDDKQKSYIASSLEEMRAQVAKGDENAKQRLAMAETALNIANTMTVKLTKEGRYIANFGQGETAGTYKMYGTKLIVKPDDKPQDKTVPADFEMTFDKASKSLTVDYQGQKMVMKRVD